MRERIAGISRQAASRLRRQARRAFAAEGRRLAVGGEPFGGAIDDAQRRMVAVACGVTPGEQAVAAEHHAVEKRVFARQMFELEAELETRAPPGQPADLVAENLPGQRLGVCGGGDGDHRVGVHVIDMRVGHERMQRRVDRGGARIEIERAIAELVHHLVFVCEAAVVRLQGLEAIEIERGEAVALDRAEVAARSLDPQHLDPHAGERIGRFNLGRGVAAAEIGDAQIGSEKI
jgi:hypothetical protein